MSDTTTSVFWTLETDTGLVVLCEGHALSATNAALELNAFDEDEMFTSMTEATAVLTALTALSGNPEDQLVFGNSDGPCNDCEADAVEGAA